MKVKLSDAFELQMGKTPPRNDRECWGEGHKWISISDIGSTGKYIDATKEEITDAGVSKSGIKVVPKGTVIMSFKLSIGKTAITAEDMYTNEAIMAFINKGRYEINTDYLYHMCKGIDWLAGTNKAVLGLTLNKATMSEKEIVIPSMAEQLHVVSVLDKMDELIALRKEQLAKLDQLVKSRFMEMFGDCGHSSNKVLLEEISEFVTVGIANSATHAYADSGIVMLRNQNIKENYLDENDLIYITPDFAKKYGSKQLAENDILVIRTGYPGVACLVPKKYEGCQTFTTLIVRLKNTAQAHANYVCHYINSSFGKDYVEQSKVGVAQQNFGAKALAKMPIVVPPMELQEQFAAVVEQTNKSKLAIQQSLDKLELLKNSLMQDYFG